MRYDYCDLCLRLCSSLKGTDFGICRGEGGTDFLFRSQTNTAACINSTEDTVVLNSKTSFFTVLQEYTLRNIVTSVSENFKDELFFVILKFPQSANEQYRR